MLRLEIIQPQQKAVLKQIAKTPVFVGRDRSMDLVLDDPLVSRQHAVIITRDEEFVIQDLGARNPLRVNQKVVVSHVLSPGDVIGLGNTQLVFTPLEGGSRTTAGEYGSGARRAGGEPADFTPTVLDARERLHRFRDAAHRTPHANEPEGSAASLPAREAAVKDVDGDTMQGVLASPRAAAGLRSQRNLRILQGFSELIRNITDRQRLLEAALAAVFDNLEVKRGFIGFFSPGGQLEISVERKDGDAAISYSRSMVERVRREAVAILFSDQPEDFLGSQSMRDSKSVVILKIKSAMCLPLFQGDQVSGILYVDNRERAESFTQEDLDFANILSYLISLAIEKDALYERIHEENIELKTILHQKNRLVGASGVLKEVQRKIKRVAGFDTTVLITGESGTGKELVARAIHDRSPRRGKPFVAVNCAAIPETLLESELFGYAPRSGISGADLKGKPGKFELADGGTLFLDEIGDMSLATQAKILRVLEDRVVDRLGSMQGTRVDLRIIAATNKVLSKAVAEGKFREDLYYRLKVFQIELPPLRERREDILPLAQHFVAMHQQQGRQALELSPRAKEILLAYHWPGNCRELRHCIEEATLLSNGRTVYPENLPMELRREDNPQPFGTLAEVEGQHIRKVLDSVNWNKRRAAEMLGINRSTLYEKIRLYEIEKPQDGTGAPEPKLAELSPPSAN
jgi:transcriptional regulator with GAF, ATPase, and Fis domain